MTMDKNALPEKHMALIQQEYKLLAEFKMVQSEHIPGIYVMPSHESPLLWFGVIFVRDGLYKNGVFRFNILLPENFPTDTISPTVIFQSELFHPFICPFTGSLEIKSAFPTWNCSENHIWQLLKYIKFVFTHVEECAGQEGSPNPEANQLLSQPDESCLEKIKQCVDASHAKLYEKPPTEDKHYIQFDPYDLDTHGPLALSLKSPDYKDPLSITPPTSGVSWVKKNEFIPLSK